MVYRFLRSLLDFYFGANVVLGARDSDKTKFQWKAFLNPPVPSDEFVEIAYEPEAASTDGQTRVTLNPANRTYITTEHESTRSRISTAAVHYSFLAFWLALAIHRGAKHLDVACVCHLSGKHGYILGR